MINRTWVEGNLPHEWKTGIIIPRLKEGKPAEEPASYRPICLTSNVCKLAERLVLNRIDSEEQTDRRRPSGILEAQMY